MPTDDQIVRAAELLAAYVAKPTDEEVGQALLAFERYVNGTKCPGTHQAPEPSFHPGREPFSQASP